MNYLNRTCWVIVNMLRSIAAVTYLLPGIKNKVKGVIIVDSRTGRIFRGGSWLMPGGFKHSVSLTDDYD